MLQEQPLLLEELLEQEKREQEKQMQTQATAGPPQDVPTSASGSSLLSDHDFERLKADVFNSGNIGLNTSTTQSVPGKLFVITTELSRNHKFNFCSSRFAIGI